MVRLLSSSTTPVAAMEPLTIRLSPKMHDSLLSTYREIVQRKLPDAYQVFQSMIREGLFGIVAVSSHDDGPGAGIIVEKIDQDQRE